MFPHIADASGERRIALVMKALSNPFFSKMAEGARSFALSAGAPLDIFGIERETDVDRQISIIENLIARENYGAIVIAPADSVRLLPVCRKAMEKGIAVINIGNPFRKKSMTDLDISIPFVGSDNSRGAAMVGEYVRKKLKGAGKVMVIEGIRGVDNADLRKSGFIRAVQAQGSSIEIAASESANWHTDEAFALVMKLWKSIGPVQAVFCANDAMALGAVQALEMIAPAGKVLVCGYDDIEAVRSEMRNGRIQATVEHHPELMGRYGLRLAVAALKGERIPSTVTTPLDLVTHDTFGKKIALSISELNNPFFASLTSGAQSAADLFGLGLTIADAGNDDARQLADIRRFAKERVDAVILNPTDAETASPGIDILNAAGIPVITVDRRASEGKVACHIESDNATGGKMAAETLIRLMRGKGRILELEGIPGTTAAHDRSKGFAEAIAGRPEMRIVAREVANFDREKARAAVQNLLEKKIAFDAVFAHNDNMILGALNALEQSPTGTSPILVGFDGIPEAVDAVRNKRLAATVAQKPEVMGVTAVQSAVSLLLGDELPGHISVELELVANP